MKSVTKPVRDGAAEGRTGDWGEVVTRYPYENVGMDHLLSMENFIENQPYETFGASALNCEKGFMKKLRTFYLVLRDHSLKI